MNFPVLKKITTPEAIDTFAEQYFQCSGFNVPRDYYESNQMFGVYRQERLIGGFVLGSGNRLRTLEVFAGEAHRPELYQKVQECGPHSEMCCFWIAPDCRKKMWLNFFVWFCVGYALRVYGAPQLVFGTNSIRLATLYNCASKSTLLHTDYLNRKQTFIFHGPRKYCLLGVAEILTYKAKRISKIAGTRPRAIAGMTV